MPQLAAADARAAASAPGEYAVAAAGHPPVATVRHLAGGGRTPSVTCGSAPRTDGTRGRRYPPPPG
ncbi:hypothetical protein GCM10010251_08290 [Streptomyces aurantiogriseus]|uniref:Uncharacterized protein n=1 Tax=Streptomyces aurantiogriseus TaxID=66870 RepID=A0A918F1A5_9ACTN|nr:hypothetical protein GCM10010251_08290 [Streptomyces aurantiogriseus]